MYEILNQFINGVIANYWVAILIILVPTFMAVYYRGQQGVVDLELENAELRAKLAAVTVAPDVKAAELVKATTQAIEIVAFGSELTTASLGPMQAMITHSVPVRAVSANERFAHLPMLEIATDVDNALMDSLLTENEVLRDELAKQAEKILVLEEVVAKKETLRARYLRLLRVERKRLSFAFGAIMNRPRRPSKKALLHERVSLGTQTINVVPIGVAREWREAMVA